MQHFLKFDCCDTTLCLCCLLVLIDSVEKSFVFLLVLQNVESLYFTRDGCEFICSHSDGSYVTWSTSDASRPKEEPKTPYGRCSDILLPMVCVLIFFVVISKSQIKSQIILQNRMDEQSFGYSYTSVISL